MKKFKNYPDLAVSLLVDLKDKIGGDKVWDGHFYKTIPKLLSSDFKKYNRRARRVKSRESK
jgi:hypothetical protein